jgi:hypothetical protein
MWSIIMATASPLENSLTDDGPLVFYTEKFRAMIEANLNYLRSAGQFYTVPIDPDKAYRYEYNFYGLLRELSVPKHLLWIVMRVNGLTDPSEFQRDASLLWIPDVNVIDRLKAVYTNLDTP